MTAYFISALTIGFLSSLHCVGMCGPLALALPLNRTSRVSMLEGIFTYHLGKAITYMLLGVLVGLLGAYIPFHTSQQRLTIFMGILMIVFALYPLIIKKNHRVQQWVIKVLRPFQTEMAKQLKVNRSKAIFGIGLLNGLLPCSMVYLALSISLGIGDLWVSSAYMIFFAIGTLPAIIAFQLFGYSFEQSFRSKIQSWIPIFLLLMGVLLILRGMNLDIPYLSPSNGSLNALNPKAC
jgi:sulfite exporter TauE/SafE